MKKINQRGFSPIVILLVLILAVLVGFTGYYVYNSQKNDDKAAAPTPPVKSTATTNQSNTQDTQKFLVIKEWGVKIPLTAEITDANYSYKNGYVYLSTDSIAKKYPECGADKTTVFAYGRFDNPNQEADLPQAGQTYGQAYPNAPKVGVYYYTGASPQAECAYTASGDVDSKYQETTITVAKKAFVEALQKIQAQ